MDKLELLNTLVNERLTIAAKEINGICARIVWEVEHQYKAEVARLQMENKRQRKLLDAMLKPDVRLQKTELLHLPVHNEETVCPEKKRGNRCLDQGEVELSQTCRRQEEPVESNGSKVTLMLIESDVEEDTSPIESDRPSDGEDCEIPRDTSADKKTSPVRVLKSGLEPLKDTDGEDCEQTILFDDDGHLTSQRSSSKHLSGRNSQKRKVTRKIKEHGSTLKKLKSRKEPPKDTGTSVKGQRSPVKKLKTPRKKRISMDFSSPLFCKMCKKAFNDEAALVQHVEVHSFDCGLCGHHLEVKEMLMDHLEAHRTCTVCGKKCTTTVTLAKHMTHKHTEGKSLTCTVCCKIFSKEFLLKSHMRVHSTEKTYACTVCEKSFRHNTTLDRHMLLHTGEKSHSCDICGKSFRQKDHLTQHKMVHTGEKPFKCTICDKTFRVNATLKKHMSMHAPYKPYECLVCGKKLAREDSMRRHRKLHDRTDRKLHERKPTPVNGSTVPNESVGK